MSAPLQQAPWITTASGRHFHFLDPQPEEITIQDIAAALSRECRFGGHCREFYSVAQHSVLAARIVAHPYKLDALLHDAAEAYLKDIPSPLKMLLPDYKRIESRVDAVIRAKYKLPEKMTAPVRLADRIMLATERRDLMPPDGSRWALLEGIEPLEERICPWTPEPARRAFLLMWNELI